MNPESRVTRSARQFNSPQAMVTLACSLVIGMLCVPGGAVCAQPVESAGDPGVEVTAIEVPDEAVRAHHPFRLRWQGRNLPSELLLQSSRNHGKRWKPWQQVACSQTDGETQLTVDWSMYLRCEEMPNEHLLDLRLVDPATGRSWSMNRTIQMKLTWSDSLLLMLVFLAPTGLYIRWAHKDVLLAMRAALMGMTWELYAIIAGRKGHVSTFNKCLAGRRHGWNRITRMLNVET